MASNSHGFNNEANISEYLNGKKFKELNITMKEFIKYIGNTLNLHIDNDTEIKSETETNNKLKQDIYIFINGCKVNVKTSSFL